ncbi:MAG: hypothetical protein P4L76_09930 [Beijerinckiaceae bacterium]|nr:hypothetical protein [Beijerinckiaceae bacterium]
MRSRSFDWAEPLICEQVLNVYGAPLDGTVSNHKVAAAQTRMWLSLIDGDEESFEIERAELARLAHDAKVAVAELDRANRAVLLELVLVVVTRFRNSDRVRMSYVERLQAALRVIKQNRSLTLH